MQWSEHLRSAYGIPHGVDEEEAEPEDALAATTFGPLEDHWSPYPCSKCTPTRCECW